MTRTPSPSTIAGSPAFTSTMYPGRPLSSVGLEGSFELRLLVEFGLHETKAAIKVQTHVIATDWYDFSMLFRRLSTHLTIDQSTLDFSIFDWLLIAKRRPRDVAGLRLGTKLRSFGSEARWLILNRLNSSSMSL
jgi:hypothetical protein